MIGDDEPRYFPRPGRNRLTSPPTIQLCTRFPAPMEVTTKAPGRAASPISREISPSPPSPDEQQFRWNSKTQRHRKIKRAVVILPTWHPADY